MRFKPGDSVALRHEKFLPAVPCGVVVGTDYRTLSVTFDEDYGGGRGTYSELLFEPWEPDEGAKKWRWEQKHPPVTYTFDAMVNSVRDAGFVIFSQPLVELEGVRPMTGEQFRITTIVGDLNALPRLGGHVKVTVEVPSPPLLETE